MVVIGMWLAIVGYGIAFDGVVKLGGGQCTLIDAFRGRCQPATGVRTQSTGTQTGSTLLAQQQAAQQQQANMIGNAPIPQGSMSA